jgi:hypothetical protein
LWRAMRLLTEGIIPQDYGKDESFGLRLGSPCISANALPAERCSVVSGNADPKWIEMRI